jgi:hypothetical protein
MRSKGDGSSPLRLSRVKLAQPDGTQIPVSWEDTNVSTDGGRDWLPFVIGGAIALGAFVVIGAALIALMRRRRATPASASPSAQVDASRSPGAPEP